MRHATLPAIILLLIAPIEVVSAQQNSASCTSEEHRMLDFWVGEWDLTWPGGQGGTPAGQTGEGTNVITKTLGDCVIHESFSGQGYDGRSFSIYDARSQQWKQTWVDSQGGHILFTGNRIDGTMEMRTAAFTDGQGNQRINRMIWEDVEENSLTWRWQSSTDGGETWTDLWVISYVRR